MRTKLLLIPAIAVAGLVAAPLLFLAVELSSAPAAQIFAALTRPATITALRNTLLLVLTVTATVFVLGIATAYALTRVRLPGEKLWWILATLPLAIPSYVAGLAWVSATPVRGFFGSWLVLTLTTTPYVTLPVAAAMRRIDTATEAVARTLGKSALWAFIRMILPQLLPAAAAGSLLVALYCLAEYGVVAIMGFGTLTPAIQAAFSGSFNRTLAIVLSAFLALAAISIILAEQALRSRDRQQRIRYAATPQQLSGGATALICGGLLTVFLLAVGLPIAELLYRLQQSVAAAEIETARLLGAAGSTLLLGAAAAIIATVATLPIAYLASRKQLFSQPQQRGINALETVIFMGQGLPGIVLALSVVYLSLKMLPGIYQTVTLLLIAYVLMYLPKAMGSTRVAIEQVPLALEDTARSLGKGPFTSWSKVTGRLALPGISAGGLIVAVTVMKELPATLMLRPVGMDTLATRLWQLTDINAYGAAAPYGVTLVLVATIPVLLLIRSERPK